MLDIEYIEEMRELDNKDAKTMLADYGKTFGVDLKKTKSFDNMLADLKEAVEEISKEPMPENNEGLSITDLIDDPDTDSEDELLSDEIGNPEVHITEPLDVEVTEEFKQKANEAGLEIVKTNGELSNSSFDEAVNTIKEDESFKLPEDYIPKFALIGRAPGFMTLPWWIYQWVSENKDWKERPTDFPHPTAHETLFTMIYYINRDGSVLVRETRNSKFVQLK